MTDNIEDEMIEEGAIIEVETGPIEFPIEWLVPEEVPSKFANNLIVQHDEHSFYVLFFETRPPLVFGEEDLKKVDSVKSFCVARIIIPATRMQSFIKVLQKNYDKHVENSQEGESE